MLPFHASQCDHIQQHIYLSRQQTADSSAIECNWVFCTCGHFITSKFKILISLYVFMYHHRERKKGERKQQQQYHHHRHKKQKHHRYQCLISFNHPIILLITIQVLSNLILRATDHIFVIIISVIIIFFYKNIFLIYYLIYYYVYVYFFLFLNW